MKIDIPSLLYEITPEMAACESLETLIAKLVSQDRVVVFFRPPKGSRTAIAVLDHAGVGTRLCCSSPNVDLFSRIHLHNLAEGPLTNGYHMDVGEEFDLLEILRK